MTLVNPSSNWGLWRVAVWEARLSQDSIIQCLPSSACSLSASSLQVFLLAGSRCWKEEPAHHHFCPKQSLVPCSAGREQT